MNIIDLLKFTIEKNGSDLHLSTGNAPLIRVDGSLIAVPGTSELDESTVLSMLEKVLPDKFYTQCHACKELDLAISIDDLSRFRVNIFRQYRGLSAAFRTIPHHIPTIQELGLPNVFYQLCNLANGLILVTGPTGCGKTTTLASMIDYLNDNNDSHIITIEDPIEYVHKCKKSLVHQREVYQHTESFANALRSVLREDPNFILVGEMRDLETIRLALTAAETGHLVFATLHTNSAAESINRIIDVFPAGEKEMIRSMLSTSLQAVISQVLLKKIGGGRIVAQEIMLCNTAVRNMIRESKVHQIGSAIQTGQDTGMHSLEQNIKELIDSGLIDPALYEKFITQGVRVGKSNANK